MQDPDLGMFYAGRCRNFLRFLPTSYSFVVVNTPVLRVSDFCCSRCLPASRSTHLFTAPFPRSHGSCVLYRFESR
jgi:hypothetical protein